MWFKVTTFAFGKWWKFLCKYRLLNKSSLHPNSHCLLNLWIIGYVFAVNRERGLSFVHSFEVKSKIGDAKFGVMKSTHHFITWCKAYFDRPCREPFWRDTKTWRARSKWCAEERCMVKTRLTTTSNRLTVGNFKQVINWSTTPADGHQQTLRHTA